jgi:hypothetical protein
LTSSSRVSLKRKENVDTAKETAVGFGQMA